MDANQFIKHIQAQTGLTYAQIAELLTQKPVKIFKTIFVCKSTPKEFEI